MVDTLQLLSIFTIGYNIYTAAKKSSCLKTHLVSALDYTVTNSISSLLYLSRRQLRFYTFFLTRLASRFTVCVQYLPVLCTLPYNRHSSQRAAWHATNYSPFQYHEDMALPPSLSALPRARVCSTLCQPFASSRSTWQLHSAPPGTLARSDHVSLAAVETALRLRTGYARCAHDRRGPARCPHFT